MCSRKRDGDSRHKSDYEHIFENLFIVASESRDEFLYQFRPGPPSVSKELAKFCFPYHGHQGVEREAGTYTFVLTDEAGTQQFGYCRQLREAGSSNLVHLCMCLLSYSSHIEFFDQVLDLLSTYLEDSLEPVRLLLEALYNHPLPQPSERITLSVQGKACTFRYPDTGSLPRIPANPYLRSLQSALPPPVALEAVCALLHERRVLVTSHSLTMLTACTHGLAAMLYPLHWQHIFVPLLPEELLDYVSAPMPFLIGLHSSHMPRVTAMASLEEVVVVDLDRQQLSAITDDLSLLPRELVAVIVAQLKRPNAAQDDHYARIFLDLFIFFFGDYRQFLVSGRAAQTGRPRKGSSPALHFDMERYLNSRPASLRPFLKSLLDLQMFHQFLDHRLQLMGREDAASSDFIQNYDTDIEGIPLVPTWWVRDCLFEWEYDEEGNRGTNLKSELVAVYRMKVVDSVQRAKPRLRLAAQGMNAVGARLKQSLVERSPMGTPSLPPRSVVAITASTNHRSATDLSPPESNSSQPPRPSPKFQTAPASSATTSEKKKGFFATPTTLDSSMSEGSLIEIGDEGLGPPTPSSAASVSANTSDVLLPDFGFSETPSWEKSGSMGAVSVVSNEGQGDFLSEIFGGMNVNDSFGGVGVSRAEDSSVTMKVLLDLDFGGWKAVKPPKPSQSEISNSENGNTDMTLKQDTIPSPSPSAHVASFDPFSYSPAVNPQKPHSTPNTSQSQIPVFPTAAANNPSPQSVRMYGGSLSPTPRFQNQPNGFSNLQNGYAASNNWAVGGYGMGQKGMEFGATMPNGSQVAAWPSNGMTDNQSQTTHGTYNQQQFARAQSVGQISTNQNPRTATLANQNLLGAMPNQPAATLGNSSKKNSSNDPFGDLVWGSGGAAASMNKGVSGRKG